jgi:hypothetical protein
LDGPYNEKLAKTLIGIMAAGTRVVARTTTIGRISNQNTHSQTTLSYPVPTLKYKKVL